MKTAARLLVFLGSLVLLFSAAPAQFYFGQNKVQYTRFDWQVLTSEHFKIYFYEEEEEIAEIGAQLAEEAYREFSGLFNLAIDNPTPLILYSSPSYFEQTNVIPDMIGEATGGFTEFFKGRVVLPYTGSFAEFKKVLRHELIHVFMLEKIAAVMKGHKKTRTPYSPLWFTEGIAEAWSRPEDDQARMVMTDLVVNNILVSVPDLYQISGSFMMYKEGESFVRFLSENYGSDRLLQLFENWWRGETFEELVYLVYQKDLKKLGEEWEFSLKQRFYPQVAQREFPDRKAKKLSSGGLSVEPAPVTLNEGEARGDWVVYKANRLGYSGLYMVPLNGRQKKPVTLVKGERSRAFESLHLFRSGISANPKGEVAFVSKNNEKDRLYVYSIPKRGVVEEFDFPNLIEISSPGWSADGSTLCFEGSEKSGFSDLYTVERGSKKLERLTEDLYEDRDPVFSADGNSIIFASDRGFFGSLGYTNLYRMSFPGRQIVPITSGRQDDLYPSLSPDGQRIIYASNRGEGSDVYVLDEELRPHRITRFLTGVTHPRFTADGKKIVFSGFKNFGFQVYALDYPGLDSFPAESAAAPPAPLAWSPEKLAGEKTKGKVKYKNDFSLDLAQSAIAYDALYGPVGGLQTALTDMLGNKQYYFFLSNTASDRNSLLSSFNVGVTYVNKTRRINYGAGVYHFYDEFLDDYEGDFAERVAGGLGFASYPLSKFQRLEAFGFLRYSRRQYYFSGRRRDAALLTGSLSWVKDNSIWELSGPIDGSRYNFSVGLTSDVRSSKLFSRSYSADLRKYFRLGRASAFAVRLAGFSSSGEEPQRIYLGGSWSLRGYSRRAFYGRHMFLASHELRFPLINRLVVGFPFGNFGLEGIRGALFFDAGNAWNENFGRMKGALGMGARVNFGYLTVLRFDWARRTDFRTIESDTRFDFFFGWNF
ncbi:MAG: hypothetical protein L0196_06185 [candidate division Zixibacteria bacterium]|nr:hypothetical protein [candidate division Zixibacteria bacterium]